MKGIKDRFGSEWSMFVFHSSHRRRGVEGKKDYKMNKDSAIINLPYGGARTKKKNSTDGSRKRTGKARNNNVRPTVGARKGTEKG